jgi:hypothetical protein
MDVEQKDGKVYLRRKINGIKISLMSAPNIARGEAVMILNGKDYKKITKNLLFEK